MYSFYSYHKWYKYKLVSFPTWMTGSASQLVSFPPTWPLKWTSTLPKQTSCTAVMVIALHSWSYPRAPPQDRAHITNICSSSLFIQLLSPTSGPHRNRNTAFPSFILIFYSFEISLCQGCRLFCYHEKFSTWFFVLSLSLLLPLLLSSSFPLLSSVVSVDMWIDASG